MPMSPTPVINILLVEQREVEAINAREFIEKSFAAENIKINIIHVNNAFNAIKQLEQVHVDIIIMDHLMDRVDLNQDDKTLMDRLNKTIQTIKSYNENVILFGIGFYYWLRTNETTKDLPIIFLSLSIDMVYKSIKDYKSDKNLYTLDKCSAFFRGRDLVVGVLRNIISQLINKDLPPTT